MAIYKSRSGLLSGVNSYEIGDNFIIVGFSDARYKYSYDSCGEPATEQMKKLALDSLGLSTFIAQNKPEYEWKSSL